MNLVLDDQGDGSESLAPRHKDDGQLLRPAGDWALFLDVDGTLVEIQETPDLVEVSDHLRQVLQRVSPLLDHAVALISGRTIADLEQLFTPLALPAAGLHGLERRGSAGDTQRLGDAARLDRVRQALADFAVGNPAILFEDKGPALALHYRRVPEAEGAARALLNELLAGEEEHIRIVEGKMVFEVKLPLADKGAAIAAFMSEPPFRGRRPVFIGDDVTDEDGFAVVNELGGHSVRVGNDRPTKADFHMPNVAAVVDWLAALPDQLATPKTQADSAGGP